MGQTDKDLDTQASSMLIPRRTNQLPGHDSKVDILIIMNIDLNVQFESNLQCDSHRYSQLTRPTCGVPQPL